MRRLPLYLSILVVLLGVLALSHSSLGTRAQDATPLVQANHPIVGGWAWDTNVDDPSNALTYGVVHADGTYVDLYPPLGVGIGVWQPTVTAPPT